MSEFEKAYKRLNVRQRQAVEAIEGPVLVIAGPGTGKTELLSARVANILLRTDAKPQNILCLTFTNKAAVNMKDRIISQIGAAGAKVNANTFHSFAAEIMNLFPDNFWSAAELSVAPEAVQLDVIESIVSHLPPDNPLALKFAGQYTLLNDIKTAVNQTKKAGLTPDKLQAMIEFNLAYIDEVEPLLIDAIGSRLTFSKLGEVEAKISQITPQSIDKRLYPLQSLSSVMVESLAQAMKTDEGTGKTAATGKWKTRWLQTVEGQQGMFKERDRNNWWLNLASVYRVYRDQIHKRGFYDYDDMLVEVVSQIDQNQKMRADLQERFSHVLIDEFQDTTPAQLRLAHLVADHHTAEGKPNLMAVGDDDQAIYKFSGAELDNMLSFRRNYPSAELIVLSENYRSSQKILDLSQNIIEQAESRVVNHQPELEKTLTAKNPPSKASEIVAKIYASRELQLSSMARDIKANYSPSSEIAVLARGHDSLVLMASLLDNLKLPVSYEQAGNILDHELIEQAYLFFQLLLAIQSGDEINANSLVHRIVRWPAWGIKPEHLWQLAISARGQSWLTTMLKQPDVKIRSLAEGFIWLASQAETNPLLVTIEWFLGLRSDKNFASPVKSYYLGNGSENLNRYFRGLSAIQLLRSMVQEFSATNQPSLADFVRFIELNKQNEVIVADESPFISGQNAIQLLTVHKAKGLEFDQVYIIDAIDKNWQPKSARRQPPANLPLQPPLDEFDDYVRLMYVATTRAKRRLVFSAYHQDHAGKDVAPSVILQSAVNFEEVRSADTKLLVSVLEDHLRWPELSGGQEKQMLKSRLADFNLYATDLINFLDVSRGGPAYFKETRLLGLPESKTASLSYGSAIHAAMETAQRLQNNDKFNLDDIIKSFDTALQREQQPAHVYHQRLAQGQATLTRLFEKYQYDLPKGSISEQRIKDVRLGDARIGGTLDRIDTGGKKITIVDYKTGVPLSSFTTTDKTKMIRAYKHRLQLVFYALVLAQRDSLPPDSIEGRMVYLEAQSKKNLERSYAPIEADLDHMRLLVAAIWRRIQKLDLPDTSGYSPDIAGIKAFETDLIASERSGVI